MGIPLADERPPAYRVLYFVEKNAKIHCGVLTFFSRFYILCSMELNAAYGQTEIFQTLIEDTRYKAGREGLRVYNLDRFAAAAIPQKRNTTKPSVIKFILQNHLLLWDDTPTTLRCDDNSLNAGEDSTPFQPSLSGRRSRKAMRWSSGGVNDDRKQAIP
jgi:hypothetical protein